ncbi:YdcF family protein [Vaginisenegalia massiliensis]|uniref:YdcF family protein n=1 Tax=Vaginisenegalia massiliensis TaxID=2058294 RepID=UPI0013DD929D|nr:YdcF family protein [Vaginisenegalia massiliensis]
MTSFILAIFQDSDWTPIFMFRYFFYIISAFVMLAVPFILAVLALLIIARSFKEEGQNRLQKLFNGLIASSFLVFVAFTLWGLSNRVHFEFARFISIYSLIALYFTATVIAYMLMNLILQFLPKAKEHEAVIILGTEIGDDGQVLNTLKRRLDRTVHYHRHLSKGQQEKVIYIVSGGLDNKADMTEADRMKAYLIQEGIPEVQILAEKQARNTSENFIYSKALLAKQGIQSRPLVITSLFHLLRSAYFADIHHLKADFLGATTAFYLWPYALVREYLAFLLISKEINYIFLIFIIINGITQVFRLS